MNDCVQSYHLSPYTCGVAKWNLRLAKELGVPLVKLGQPATHPLISVKPSEIPRHQCRQFAGTYDLILHDWPMPRWVGERLGFKRNCEWVLGATHVWTVAAETQDVLLDLRSDIQVMPCPSTVDVPKPRASKTYLTFGMAHKTLTVLHQYELFRDQMGDDEDYTILLSVGVHEGSPWDGALESSAAALREIFGADRVEVLGFLSDAALHREIEAATACLAFYDPAVRSNNTTATAVLERGKVLITNYDDHSPEMLRRVPVWGDVAAAIATTTQRPYRETRSESPIVDRALPAAVVDALPNLVP